MDVIGSLVRVYCESILKNWNCPITFGGYFPYQISIKYVKMYMGYTKKIHL
jgi:hypothetical protein